MGLNNLVESGQLDCEIMNDLFSRADYFRDEKTKNLNGKILASLFYEPSTRTRLSFESAMIRLGGSVIGTENAKEFSSAVKGESLEDSIRVISNYSDCIVLRHNEEGAAKRASMVSNVPVINAGDGCGEHPTQALLDMYTIYREIGDVNSINIAMVGDLLRGRTVRSLCYLLGKFFDNNITFVSPENLGIGCDIKDYLKRHDVKFREESDLNSVLGEVDVVYMTRIQKERGISEKEYLGAKGKYVINHENFELIKPYSRIMHPLPHVEEIDLPIEIEENSSRVAYFRQAENGLYVRMALLDMLLNE